VTSIRLASKVIFSTRLQKDVKKTLVLHPVVPTLVLFGTMIYWDAKSVLASDLSTTTGLKTVDHVLWTNSGKSILLSALINIYPTCLVTKATSSIPSLLWSAKKYRARLPSLTTIKKNLITKGKTIRTKIMIATTIINSLMVLFQIVHLQPLTGVLETLPVMHALRTLLISITL